jgi:hypothetical protein
MVITRHCANKYNIKLHEGLEDNKKKRKLENNSTIIINILIFTLIFTLSTILYYYLFEYNNNSLYNFIIIDLPEKTIITLYNKLPSRPYNKYIDMIYDFTVEDYF